MNLGVLNDSIKCLKRYLTPSQKKDGWIIVILLVISSFLDVLGLASLIPIIMAASEPGSLADNNFLFYLYSHSGFNSESLFLIFLIVLIFIFFIVKNIFTTWIGYRQVRFTAGVTNNIVKNQYLKFSNLPFLEFNNVGYVNVLYYIINIPEEFSSGILRGLITIFSEMAILLIIVIGIFTFKPVLILLLGAVLIPSFLFTYNKLKKVASKIGDRINELKPIANAIAIDSLLGRTEIKLAGKEDDFRKRIMGVQNELQLLEAKVFLMSSIPHKIIEVVAILGIVTIFIYSILFANNPKELLPILGLFAASAYRLMPSINRLMVSMVELKKNQYAIEMLQEFEHYPVSAMGRSETSLTFNNTIEIRQLIFYFPGQAVPAINNISLKIHKGEKIGFIGNSGSGKTTLMNLILRFYTEQSGSILVDGVKLVPDNSAAWQRKIGYVKQDTFLMNVTIRDNIILFDENPDDQLLDEAIEKASLKDFLDSLPKGMNTVIGDRGSKLSGGQRQRIAIARALYKKKDVLIFDEATNALDNTTEKEVNEAISKLYDSQITILIIAHRITSLKECDKIYEIRNGEIVSLQSYTELMRQVI